MTLAPRSVGYVALLVALGSFGSLTMSIYTPVMPSVGADLGAGSDSVKLTPKQAMACLKELQSLPPYRPMA